ncbi:MAG: hypothetical protein ACI9RZ_002116, partial [Sphingobacteriales bacterium]
MIKPMSVNIPFSFKPASDSPIKKCFRACCYSENINDLY